MKGFIWLYSGVGRVAGIIFEIRYSNSSHQIFFFIKYLVCVYVLRATAANQRLGMREGC
jgi:hypothetical protein